MQRQASVIVSDDFLVSLQGKITIIGVYTGDIVIAQEEFVINQLVFTFIVEFDIDDVPPALTLEVTLPGEAPRQMSLPLTPPPAMLTRRRFITRMPFLISQAPLRAGRIEARAFYEGEEILASAPWVVSLAKPTEATQVN